MGNKDMSTSQNGVEQQRQVTLHIAVGSKNPCKINSVKDALLRVIQNKPQIHNVVLKVEGFNVPSGVADQPMGDEETMMGADNRAKKAYEEYKKKFSIVPNLAVGLEGGLEWCRDKKILTCMAWMVCYGKRNGLMADILACPNSTHYTGDKKPIYGRAKTASFTIPPAVTELVKQGMELGEADDVVFKRINSKQGSGTVGILSGNIIDRSAYYEHALVLALVPWIRPDLYPDGSDSSV